MPINAQILDNPKSDRVRRIADLTRAKGRERSGRFLSKARNPCARPSLGGRTWCRTCM